MTITLGKAINEYFDEKKHFTLGGNSDAELDAWAQAASTYGLHMAGVELLEILTNVDQVALSLLGWQVDDFRARVVGNGDLARLSVSLRAHFNPDDWSERFDELDSDSFAPSMVIVIEESAVASASTLMQTLERVKKARRGLVHTINEQYLSTPAGWRSPGRLRISLTAYDGCDVSMRDAGLLNVAESVKIELSDETTKSLFTFGDVRAQMLRSIDRDEDGYRLRLEGLARVDASARRGGQRDYDWVHVYPPEIEVEMLDASGFVLADRTANPMSRLRSDQIPMRVGRWVEEVDFGKPHETPARVVIRIVDNGDGNNEDDL